MTVRVTPFTNEYADLGAWTGETEEEIRAQNDLHDEDRERWLAWDGDRVVGAVHPWRRPDSRYTLYFDRCRADAYAPLAAAAPGECFTLIDADNDDAIAALTGAGFAEHRREHTYEIRVRPIDAPVPHGLRIVTADATDLEPLMMLDCALREDVPGSEGWQPDAVWFREETYDSPFFDPMTYRVALDGDAYVGLARVWHGPRPRPRLGLVGVLAPYRRRGLARALVAQAFAPMLERGPTVVEAEADSRDVAANSLLAGLGATLLRSTIELRRP
jgi:RimJ/RimL family protein N-acetyltransferase